MCLNLDGNHVGTCVCNQPAALAVKHDFGWTYYFASWTQERGWFYSYLDKPGRENDKLTWVEWVKR